MSEKREPYFSVGGEERKLAGTEHWRLWQSYGEGEGERFTVWRPTASITMTRAEAVEIARQILAASEITPEEKLQIEAAQKRRTEEILASSAGSFERFGLTLNVPL